MILRKRLAFYGEMLDDRIEEGLSEDAAVAEIGDANEIVRQTVADIPLAKLAKEKIKPKRRLKAWEIILWHSVLLFGCQYWTGRRCTDLLALCFGVGCNRFAVVGLRFACGLCGRQCAVMRSACRGRQRRIGDCCAFGGNYMRGAFDIYVLRLQGDCKRNFDSYKEDNHRVKNRFIGKGEA